MLQAVGQLRLVAPPEIAEFADDLRLRISGYARVESRTENMLTDFDHLQDVLYDLMREDLGELSIRAVSTHAPINPLTVRSLSRNNLTDGELAFLPACSTTDTILALADEAVHMTSDSQFVGYGNIIGTL